jgi:hypothetical protein
MYPTILLVLHVYEAKDESLKKTMNAKNELHNDFPARTAMTRVTLWPSMEGRRILFIP